MSGLLSDSGVELDVKVYVFCSQTGKVDLGDFDPIPETQNINEERFSSLILQYAFTRIRFPRWMKGEKLQSPEDVHQPVLFTEVGVVTTTRQVERMSENTPSEYFFWTPS